MNVKQTQADINKRECDRQVTVRGHPTLKTLEAKTHIEADRRNDIVASKHPATEVEVKHNIYWTAQCARINDDDVTHIDDGKWLDP